MVVVHTLNEKTSLLKKPEIEAAVCEINKMAYYLLKLKI